MEKKIVQRSKTAITRKALSRPAKYLIKHNLIVGKVLDYGCGKGFDATVLKCDKYDPYFFPKQTKRKYNTILCTYVLNVIKSKQERLRVINHIQSKLYSKGKAYISVRRDLKHNTKTQAVVILKLPKLFENNEFCIYEVNND